MAEVAGQMGASIDASGQNVTLYVYREGLLQGVPGDNLLVYEVEVTNGQDIREFLYVDAHSGRIVNQISGIHEAGLDRKVSETSLANVIWEDSNGDPDPITAGWAGGTAQQVTDWQNEIDGAAESTLLPLCQHDGGRICFLRWPRRHHAHR